MRRYEVKTCGAVTEGEAKNIGAVNRIEAIVRFFNARLFTRPGTPNPCLTEEDINSQFYNHLSVRALDKDTGRFGPWEEYKVIVHDLKPRLPSLPERHVHVEMSEKEVINHELRK